MPSSSRRDRVTADCDVVIDAQLRTVLVESRASRLLQLHFDFEESSQHYELHFPSAATRQECVSVEVPPNTSALVCNFNPIDAGDAGEMPLVYQVTALVAGDEPETFVPAEALPVGAVVSSTTVDVGDGGVLVLEISDLVGGGHRFGLTIKDAAPDCQTNGLAGCILELSIEGSTNLLWVTAGPNTTHVLGSSKVAVALFSDPASFVIGDVGLVEEGLTTELRYVTSLRHDETYHGAQDDDATAHVAEEGERGPHDPQAVPIISVTDVDAASQDCVQSLVPPAQTDCPIDNASYMDALKAEEIVAPTSSQPETMPQVVVPVVGGAVVDDASHPREPTPPGASPYENKSPQEALSDAQLPLEDDPEVTCLVASTLMVSEGPLATTPEALVPPSAPDAEAIVSAPATAAIALTAPAAEPVVPVAEASAPDAVVALSSSVSGTATVAHEACLESEQLQRSAISEEEQVEWRYVLIAYAGVVCALCHLLLGRCCYPMISRWCTANGDVVSLAVHPQCAARAPVCAACNTIIVGAYVAEATGTALDGESFSKEVPYHIACAQGYSADSIDAAHA